MSDRAAPSAAIRVHRPGAGWAGLRSVVVVLDGDPVGRVAEGATETLSVPPGVHRLWVHIDWKGSPHYEVVVEAGRTTSVRVVFAGSGWNPFRGTPHGLLRLEEVEADRGSLREVPAPASEERAVRWRAGSRVVLAVALAALATVLAYAAGVRLG